jgi:hypothetical protein
MPTEYQSVQLKAADRSFVENAHEEAVAPVPKNRNHTSFTILLDVSVPAVTEIVTFQTVGRADAGKAISPSVAEEGHVATDVENACESIRYKASYYWNTHR